ncbi:MAG: hypothetical protein SGPRY_012949, partial [Prymnesium sp.]
VQRPSLYPVAPLRAALHTRPAHPAPGIPRASSSPMPPSARLPAGRALARQRTCALRALPRDIKGKVIGMQVKCEKGVAVTLIEADSLYEDCVDLYYMLVKVFKYMEIEPGEPDEQLQIFKDWLWKMKLERFLAHFEERNCADLHILIKMGSDKVYEMLKQIGAMKSEDAALFMLNYTNLLYFDGDEHSFR